jgi:type 1 glutamine amidotransferase
MRTFLSALLAVALAVPAFAEDKVKVLIVDGQNNHDWRATTPVMKKWLEASGRFSVEVATAPTRPREPQKPKPDAGDEAKKKYEQDLVAFADANRQYKLQMMAFRPNFAEYQVVVSNYNGDSWPAETNAALEAALKSGKIGLVIVHAANNSFGGWKEYNRMIGMGWRDNKFGDRLIVTDSGAEKRVPKGQGPGAGHGPMHAFQIVIRDAEHPVVKGMPREWLHASDELYQGMRGPVENVHLIATAFADKEKYRGSGEHEPMIWTVNYGEGRVFHTPMGHDVGAMRCVGFIATIQRGTEWAATGKVTIPLPENFPTAEKISTVK